MASSPRNLEQRHLWMAIGAAIAIFGIALGLLSRAIYAPMLIILIGAGIVLGLGFGPALARTRILLAFGLVLISFPATVLIHELSHFTLGSILWPGKMDIMVQYMSGMTTASIDIPMAEQAGTWGIWLFYSVASFICLTIGALLLLAWPTRGRMWNGLRLYAVIFGGIMVGFNMFAMLPSGSSDFGQAVALLEDSGGSVAIALAMHVVIFLIAAAIVAVVAIWLVDKKRVI